MGDEIFTAGWNVVSGEVATAEKFNQLGGNDDYLKGAVERSTPVGAIADYIGTSDPIGWLIANGRNVNRSDYADLFALIGTAYGAGDGSTTFALPNLSGKVMVGLDSGDSSFSSIGKTGGEKAHKLSLSEMPRHDHSINPPTTSTSTDSHSHTAGKKGTSGSFGVVDSQDASSSGDLRTSTDSHKHSVNIGSFDSSTRGDDASHNNLQPYFVVNKIIKV